MNVTTGDLLLDARRPPRAVRVFRTSVKGLAGPGRSQDAVPVISSLACSRQAVPWVSYFLRRPRSSVYKYQNRHKGLQILYSAVGP